MTGGVESEADEDFLAVSGRRVLAKPFELATLRALVAELAVPRSASAHSAG
jgi:hypothetical protein